VLTESSSYTRAKTRVPVRVPLPTKLTELLRPLPTVNPNYFFWSGYGRPRDRKEGMAARTSPAVQAGEDQEAGWHSKTLPPAHMFHDTFAVELLLSSVPIDRVASCWHRTA
jgi:integrase/recombinase XerD